MTTTTSAVAYVPRTVRPPLHTYTDVAQQTTWNFASHYWLVWFIASFGAFLVYELYQLAIGHPENTLSAQVWRMEGILNRNYPIADWTAVHFLLGGMFILTFLWLGGHFVFGVWR
jgi:hypothetical protein